MMKSGRDYMMWKLELKVRRKKKGWDKESS
jgi:hypothetical protein